MRPLGDNAQLVARFDMKPFKRVSSARMRWAYVAVLVGLCSTFAGCSGLKVQLPTSDSTPPSLVWNVFNHETQQQADYPGSPTINVKRGDSYRVILKANDPEGVK